MEPKSYVCYRATEAVQIDGDLMKAVWQEAAWTDDFVDIELFASETVFLLIAEYVTLWI